MLIHEKKNLITTDFFKKGRTFSILVLSTLLILQLFIYIEHVGTGFIKDDFNWLGNVIADGEVDYLKPFSESTGFYRPLISLSFGIQYQIHGMNPRPYGVFNLFIHILNILLIFLILFRNEETRSFALLVTALFALNAKANRMAIGWISARTTLLCSFFLLLAFYLFQNLQKVRIKKNKNLIKTTIYYISINIIFFAALLSKETALGMPFFVFIYTFVVSKKKIGISKISERLYGAGKSIMIFLFPLILYFLLRLNSDAFTPVNAPDFYRYTFSPLMILKNISEYIIRAGMLDIIIAVFLFATIPFITKKSKQKQKIDSSPLMPGVIWFICFLLPSLLIPVRSDLYAYFPQIGFHLVFIASIFIVFKNLKLKKTEHLYKVLIPLLLIITVWISHLFIKATEIGRRGQNSVLFSNQIITTISTTKSKKRLCIVDKDIANKHSPLNTVSYGFPELLNLYFPNQNLNGFIIGYNHSSSIKKKFNMSYFIWENNQLNGPYTYRRLKKLISEKNEL